MGQKYIENDSFQKIRIFCFDLTKLRPKKLKVKKYFDVINSYVQIFLFQGSDKFFPFRDKTPGPLQ